MFRHREVGMLIGYGCISYAQDPGELDSQRDLLIEAGCRPEDLHLEATWATDRRRPGLERAITQTTAGDTLVICDLGDFARSIPEIWAAFSNLHRRGIFIRVLGISLDTATSRNSNVDRLFKAITNFETDMQLLRQREGMLRATETGKQVGRPGISDQKKRLVLDLRASGKSIADIMRETLLSRASVFRILKQTE